MMWGLGRSMMQGSGYTMMGFGPPLPPPLPIPPRPTTTPSPSPLT